MKKTLLTAGILLIAAGILFLLFGILNWHGYYHLLDGDGDLYTRMYRSMIIGFVTGSVLTVVGIACFIIRTKY